VVTTLTSPKRQCFGNALPNHRQKSSTLKDPLFSYSIWPLVSGLVRVRRPLPAAWPCTRLYGIEPTWSSSITYDKRSTHEVFIRGEIYFVDASVLHLREFVDVETTVERLLYVYCWRSAAAESGSDAGADAGGSRLQRRIRCDPELTLGTPQTRDPQ
jgi:hypothetical protein